MLAGVEPHRQVAFAEHEAVDRPTVEAVAKPGTANLSMSTNQLAERFGACAMTLEMPFKDNDDLPDPAQGWSPERSKLLARDCLASLLEWLEADAA